MSALLLALALAGSPAAAEPASRDEIIEGVGFDPIDPPVTDVAELDARTHALAKGLRCPVCQGLSVADSSSEAAVAMKNRIRDLVEAGYTEEQVTQYFVGRYGTWVLLEPPAQGANWLIFFGPAGLVALGLLAVVVVVRKRGGLPQPPSAEPTTVDADDPYIKRVLAELEES